VIAGTLLAAGTLAAAPARAEHLTLQSAEEHGTFDLDVDLKLGADGFRLGGRLLGPKGVWGAWLNGRVRRDGFTLDGRVQDPDKATNFRFDADITEWLRRGWPGTSL
jgi:hypothetical protein